MLSLCVIIANRAASPPNENSAPKICIIRLPLAGPITKSELMALASVSPTVAGSKPKKLLDQTRDVLRLKHYSLRAERSYCDWIERCDDLRRPAVWLHRTG